jgi:hypothetical protein
MEHSAGSYHVLQKFVSLTLHYDDLLRCSYIYGFSHCNFNLVENSAIFSLNIDQAFCVSFNLNYLGAQILFRIVPTHLCENFDHKSPIYAECCVVEA